MEVELISYGRNAIIWRFTINGRPLLLGRHSDNDVRITDPEVSRHHCLVEQTRDSLVVRDLGSFNGTFVNGCRITEAMLKSGDKLTMGNTAFTVSYRLDATTPRALRPAGRTAEEGIRSGEAGHDGPGVDGQTVDAPIQQEKSVDNGQDARSPFRAGAPLLP